MKLLCAALCALLTAPALANSNTFASPSTGDELRAAVREVDDCYAYEVLDSNRIGKCTATTLALTSQPWQGAEWKHWLSILVPDELTHTDAAILFITGGSTKSSPPKGTSTEALMLSSLATRSGAVMAVLQQVPNQPLYGDLTEDRLVAYTFDKYLDGEGDDWPLLVPMVESAVRAMDTVQSYTKDVMQLDIQGFIVSGASKRGWTTWLTAAADDRVRGIAPMVIDMLNLTPQMEQQKKTYGGFSEQIRPYTDLKIQERMRTDIGARLRALVDPYEYRNLLLLPKLIVLGTNDPFWTVNASSHYFPDLKHPKAMFYLPNGDHGLGLGILPTMASFFRATLSGKTLPEFTWSTPSTGTLVAKWRDRSGVARLWQAHSHNRDFREVEWTSTDIDGALSCKAELSTPEEGWNAYFIEVRFRDGENRPCRLSTEIQVRPDTFPYELSEESGAEKPQ
jgi:PhoPQ-activated pathogenicity-related protein